MNSKIWLLAQIGYLIAAQATNSSTNISDNSNKTQAPLVFQFNTTTNSYMEGVYLPDDPEVKKPLSMRLDTSLLYFQENMLHSDSAPKTAAIASP